MVVEIKEKDDHIGIKCEYNSMVESHPSKVDMPVRIRLLAPYCSIAAGLAF